MRRLISNALRRFKAAHDGATAIEYALIAAGVAGALFAAILLLGGTVNNMWTNISNAFH